MAFLIGIFSALLMLSTPAEAGGDASPAEVVAAAAQGLVRCEGQRAKDDAEKLDRLRPQGAELGELFRIAWVEQGTGRTKGPYVDSERPTVAWKCSSEDWNDERVRWECVDPKPIKDWTEGDAALVANLFHPFLTPQGPTTDALRRMGARWLAAQWILAKPVEDLPALDPNAPCEWAAALALFDAKGAGLEPLLARCAVDKGTLNGIAGAELWTRLGDRQLKQGKFKPAFHAYEKAAERAAPAQIPRALWYRLAVSAFFGSDYDDAAFRAVFRLRDLQAKGEEAEEDKEPSVTPAHIAALTTLACDRAAELQPDALAKLFAKILDKRRWVSESLSLLDSCDAKRVAPLFARLATAATDPRDRARLYAKEIEAHAGDAKRQRTWIDRMREVAKTHPYVAAQSMSRLADQRRITADQLVAYLKKTPANPTLTARVERLKRPAPKDSPANPTMPLAADTKRDAKPLELPVALDLLPVKWESRFPLNAVEAFATAAKEVGSNR